MQVSCVVRRLLAILWQFMCSLVPAPGAGALGAASDAARYVQTLQKAFPASAPTLKDAFKAAQRQKKILLVVDLRNGISKCPSGAVQIMRLLTGSSRLLSDHDAILPYIATLGAASSLLAPASREQGDDLLCSLLAVVPYTVDSELASHSRALVDDVAWPLSYDQQFDCLVQIMRAANEFQPILSTDAVVSEEPLSSNDEVNADDDESADEPLTEATALQLLHASTYSSTYVPPDTRVLKIFQIDFAAEGTLFSSEKQEAFGLIIDRLGGFCKRIVRILDSSLDQRRRELEESRNIRAQQEYEYQQALEADRAKRRQREDRMRQQAEEERKKEEEKQAALALAAQLEADASRRRVEQKAEAAALLAAGEELNLGDIYTSQRESLIELAVRRPNGRLKCCAMDSVKVEDLERAISLADLLFEMSGNLNRPVLVVGSGDKLGVLTVEGDGFPIKQCGLELAGCLVSPVPGSKQLERQGTLAENAIQSKSTFDWGQ